MTGLVCRDHRGEANAKDRLMDRAEMRARGAIIVDGLVCSGKEGQTGHSDGSVLKVKVKVK